jgi:RNA polymerase sigma-70 factor (ECF subfamily)
MLKAQKIKYPQEITPRESHERVGRISEIFHKYHDKIYSIILFHINDKSEADDIFQNLFLCFLRNPIPAGTKNVMAYIYKTITNDVFDLIRKRKKYQGRLSRYAEKQKYISGASNPENIAIQAEEIQKLFNLIEKRLPRHQAQVIHLRYIKEYTTFETARHMGIDEKTVSRYLWAGLKQVQKLSSKTELGPKVC